ncbi:two-component sensor histidine kinase [Billgrantia diversa]|uniref:ATP-binding protein n=1 Tax=Halomonas sp. MCCC 1A13316 TaxID=2733487 RepID=UPI0018A5B075|nr:ATP-binding protein [Halomonas sp. MCCC 1A13316]QOR39723.1 two-component sensor histidine kinase [Halomonas sp. MCCC 1A13316]
MSLRARLLLTLGLTLVLLWGLAAAWLLRDLHDQFVATLDQRLAQSARMVAALAAQLPQEVWLAADRQALTIPPIEGLACQVHSPSGEIMARTHADMEDILSAGGQGHSYRESDGVTWRVFTYERDGLTITTADRMDERNLLLGNVIKVAVVPFVVALLGSLVAIWFGVIRGLAPLERLRGALSQRHPDDLESVSKAGMPAEIRPLIDALNALLARVHAAFIREQRFTSDAAHELRTPLTAAKTHLQVARRLEGPASHKALEHAEQGMVRLARTIDQLLTLSRVEGRLVFDDGEPSWIEAVVKLARWDADPTGAANIELTGTWPAWELAMPRELAVTALRNLIDNALRHGRAGSPVTLSVESEPSGCDAPNQVTFCVHNEVAGIDPDTLPQLTRRFWRNGTQQGSGLGLSIVAAIAARFGGAVSFRCPTEGGFEAQLTLPLVQQQEGPETPDQMTRKGPITTTRE